MAKVKVLSLVFFHCICEYELSELISRLICSLGTLNTLFKCPLVPVVTTVESAVCLIPAALWAICLFSVVACKMVSSSFGSAIVLYVSAVSVILFILLGALVHKHVD